MTTNYWGDDSWETRGRRPSPHGYRSDAYLNLPYGAGHNRSRSAGQGAVPIVNVYNRLNNDQESYTPYPPSRSPSRSHASPRHSPQARPYRHADDIVEGLAAIELDRQRNASRSRGRSDVSGVDRQQVYNEFALAQREQELRDATRRREIEREEEHIRNEMRYNHLQDEEHRRLERQRYEDEVKARLLEQEMKETKDREAVKLREKQWEGEVKAKLLEQEMKETKDREAAKLREKHWEDEYERKKRDAADKAKAEEQRVKDELERKQREEKDREEREYRAFLQKEADKKKKEEDDYNNFLRIQKEKEDKKKAEEKEAEGKFQDEMRHRLRELGYTERTIEIMVDKEKSKTFKDELERKTERTTELDVWRPAKAPVYPKVHRNYIEIETLKFFGLEWEYDRNDPDYIIILRDMSKAETDILFEHTARRRTGVQYIESGSSKKKPEYAWIRKRSKSRSGEKRVSIIDLGGR